MTRLSTYLSLPICLPPGGPSPFDLRVANPLGELDQFVTMMLTRLSRLAYSYPCAPGTMIGVELCHPIPQEDYVKIEELCKQLRISKHIFVEPLQIGSVGYLCAGLRWRWKRPLERPAGSHRFGLWKQSLRAQRRLYRLYWKYTEAKGPHMERTRHRVLTEILQIAASCFASLLSDGGGDGALLRFPFPVGTGITTAELAEIPGLSHLDVTIHFDNAHDQCHLLIKRKGATP